DLDDLLLLARLVLTLLLFVFELAEVEDLANRRIGVGRDLDQIEACFDGAGNCVVPRNHPYHVPVLVDEPHAEGGDFFVDARTVIPGWRWRGGWTRDADAP